MFGSRGPQTGCEEIRLGSPRPQSNSSHKGSQNRCNCMGRYTKKNRYTAAVTAIQGHRSVEECKTRAEDLVQVRTIAVHARTHTRTHVRTPTGEGALRAMRTSSALRRVARQGASGAGISDRAPAMHGLLGRGC